MKQKRKAERAEVAERQAKRSKRHRLRLAVDASVAKATRKGGANVARLQVLIRARVLIALLRVCASRRVKLIDECVGASGTRRENVTPPPQTGVTVGKSGRWHPATRIRYAWHESPCINVPDLSLKENVIQLKLGHEDGLRPRNIHVVVCSFPSASHSKCQESVVDSPCGGALVV